MGQTPDSEEREERKELVPLRWSERFAQGAVVGALAGALGALADLASTVLWLAPGRDRAWLTAVLLALGAALGTITAVVCASVDRVLSARLRSVTTRHALIVALPLTVTAHLLFTGGFMRRLPARWALVSLTALCLVALGAFSLTAVRAITKLILTRSVRTRRFAALCAFVLAWVLHGADHRVLPRLYEYLHAGLGALTFLFFAVSVIFVLPERKFAPRTIGLATVVIVSLGALAFVKLPSLPNVRAEVYGAHSPFVRHGVLALDGVLPKRSERFDAGALRAARRRLERSTARESLLPVIDGASVLLITVDALRADRLRRRVDGVLLAPFMASLADGGVEFTRAYTQAPHSSYSLTTLHTGEFVHETVPLGQRQPLVTIAGALTSVGWSTAALYTRGIFFTEGERLAPYRDSDFGFARADHVDRDETAQTVAAERELDALTARGAIPAMVWVHYFDVHAPYQGRGATDLERYDDAVRHVDRGVARLVTYARRALHDRVIVVLTADHGEEFGEHGGVYHGSTLYEEQVRVPLVIAAPGLAHRTVTAPVGLVDVAPTLLGLVGVSRPESMAGYDLRAVMVGLAEAPRAVFAGVNTRKMVVRGGHKLVVDLTRGVEELYDLESDPAERRNRAGDGLGVRSELRVELEAWIESLAERVGGTGPIARARMGDRSAARELVTLAADTRTRESDRVDALTLLADLDVTDQGPALRRLLGDRSIAVADAAAVALGLGGDRSVTERLSGLVLTDPFERRWRAARALARVGDPRGTETLCEGLHREESVAIESLKSLTELGSPGAIESLLEVYADVHLRYRVVLALGATRDPRVFRVLSDAAVGDPTEDVRANATAALGRLGDSRAVEIFTERLSSEAPGRYALEALDALGALGTLGQRVDGWSARNAYENGVLPGWDCTGHDDDFAWRYLGARRCVTSTRAGAFGVRVTRGGRKRIVFRARRNDGPETRVNVTVDGRVLTTVTLSAQWSEHSADERLRAGTHTVVFTAVDPTARVALGQLAVVDAR